MPASFNCSKFITYISHFRISHCKNQSQRIIVVIGSFKISYDETYLSNDLVFPSSFRIIHLHKQRTYNLISPRVHIYFTSLINTTNNFHLQDGSMSASGSAGRGSIPGGVVNFNLRIFNLGARRGGDVHFLIARLYITGLD